LSDAYPLLSPQLLERDIGAGLVIESHAIHANDNLEPGGFLGCQKGLPQEIAARASAAKTLGVKTNPVFTDPQYLAVIFSECFDGGMR
jgi:hypothetical protein